MSEKFEEVYAEISSSEKEFLLEFMFQLTIVGRQLHSELEGEPLSSASKQMNEINHRVLNRIKGIEDEGSFFSKEYLLEMVAHHVNLSPVISNGVDYAANKARAKVIA